VIDALTRLAALGVILPVTGGLHRAIAFAMSGLVPPFVGGDLAIPELALVGTGLLLPGVVIGVAFALWFRDPPRFRIPVPTLRLTPEVHAWLRRGLQIRVVRLIVAVGLAALALGLILFVLTPGLFSILLASEGLGNLLTTVVTAAVVWWGYRLEREGRYVPLRRLLPMLVVLTLATALASSLGPTTAGTYIASVHFDAAAGVSDGTYSVVAESDGQTWLVSCTRPATVVRTATSLIGSLRLEAFGPGPTRIPTIAESLQSNVWVAGYQPRCP
jgi:hypothetical protein